MAEINDNEKLPVSEQNIITSEAIKDIEADAKVPAGYLDIQLSTNGYLYAPKKFHIRNFTTDDVMGLAITDDEYLPFKVCELMQKLIWEKDVNVRDFHMKEVEETLYRLYVNFYSTVMKDIEYNPTEEDLKWLADHNGGDESETYRKMVRDLKSGKWKPKIDQIDLNQVTTNELDASFKKRCKVKKPSGFSCAYEMPHYGDVLTLQEFANRTFKERDKQFAKIEKMLKFENEAKEKWYAGEAISIEAIPGVPDAEIKKYNDYQLEKSIFYMIAIRALHLVEYKGEDVSNLPLDKKFELARDPELDYGTFKKINDAFEKVKVGLNTTVKILNPITNQVGDYEQSFRLFTILQALVSNEPNGVTIEFE